MSWGQYGAQTTPRKLMQSGQWENYCEFNDMDPNCIITGEMDIDEPLEPGNHHVSSRFDFNH